MRDPLSGTNSSFVTFVLSAITRQVSAGGTFVDDKDRFYLKFVIVIKLRLR